MSSLWRMIRLSALAAFAPERFLKADTTVSDMAFNREQLRKLRSGWASSLGLMTYAAVVGLLLGRIALRELGEQPTAAMLLGIAGGVVLLWSAIALRGWDIQTMDGETLVEQINTWIVRAACFVGTTFAVISVSWGTST